MKCHSEWQALPKLPGQSFRKHQYSPDKSQFTESTNRLQSSPHSVDKYDCWACCAIIMRAWKEAGRKTVMIVFGVYWLPIKITSCSACDVAADDAELPRVPVLCKASRAVLRAAESCLSLLFYRELISWFIRKDVPVYYRGPVQEPFGKYQMPMHLGATQKLLGCFF